MNIRFVDRKSTQPNNVRFYAEKKLTKLDKLFRGEADTTVTFSPLKKDKVKVEIAVSCKGALYRGESSSDDPNAAIDAAVAIIERQIRKYKTRLAKHLREDSLADFVADVAPSEAAEEADDIRIERVKKFAIKPMTAEEAVLQMNLTGHDFYVFRNAEDSDTVSVVYARKSGGYGLIADVGNVEDLE